MTQYRKYDFLIFPNHCQRTLQPRFRPRRKQKEETTTLLLRSHASSVSMPRPKLCFYPASTCAVAASVPSSGKTRMLLLSPPDITVGQTLPAAHPHLRPH
eukprot:PhF_6_TR37576/c0_g1_i5/m.55730